MFDLIDPREANLTIQPLLCVALVAASLYYYFINNRSVGKKITVTEDSGQFQAVGPESPSTACPHTCCSTPELENTVRELEGLLCKVQQAYEAKSLECDQQRQSYIFLQAETNKRNKLLQLKQDFLKVSLVDAELNYQTSLDSISHLEEEKSELMNLVDSLRFSVHVLGEELCLSHLESDELLNEFEQNKEAHKALQLEYEEMKNEHHLEEVLKVSLFDAELKHQKSLVSQLEEEKSELMNLVDSLRFSVQALGEELCLSHHESDELLNEYEQNKEAHNALQLEYEEMKNKLFHKEEVLKVTLADAELKHQKSEKEKSELMNLVDSLHFSVLVLGEELRLSLIDSDELLNDCEQKNEALSALQLKHEAVMKNLKHTEELLKMCVTDAVSKHQKSLDSISQQEEERSELKNRVALLRSTVQELGEDLCQCRLENDELQIVSKKSFA